MNPAVKAPAQSPSKFNDAAGPPMPEPSLVENIPVHTPGQAQHHRDEDAELDKIMQDVGKEMRKDAGPPKKHHFWELNRHHKKEANFSTQMSIKNAPPAAAVKPRPAPLPRLPAAAAEPPAPSRQAQPAHSRVKAAAQKPSKPPKAPKPPKQNSAPVMVIVLTVLVTAALIAVAYHVYR